MYTSTRVLTWLYLSEVANSTKDGGYLYQMGIQR